MNERKPMSNRESAFIAGVMFAMCGVVAIKFGFEVAGGWFLFAAFCNFTFFDPRIF